MSTTTINKAREDAHAAGRNAAAGQAVGSGRSAASGQAADSGRTRSAGNCNASSTDTICGLARSRFIAQAGVIAALYAAATLVTMLLLQGLAWGPVQFRISEAVCVVALLTPAAVPGLTVGCVIANLINLVVSGTGALGLLDVVFGSCATLVGALFCWKLRSHPRVAVLGPVIANAVIVPAYLPLLLQGLGYYTIPFTTIALDGAYVPMYLFGLVATGVGEALVMYALGLPLLAALKHSNVGGLAAQK